MGTHIHRHVSTHAHTFTHKQADSGDGHIGALTTSISDQEGAAAVEATVDDAPGGQENS